MTGGDLLSHPDTPHNTKGGALHWLRGVLSTTLSMDFNPTESQKVGILGILDTDEHL